MPFMGNFIQNMRAINWIRHSLMLEKRGSSTSFKRFRKINGAQLNIATILGSSGMYKESIELLESIPINQTPNLKGYFYGTYRIVYGYLTEYAASMVEKQKYKLLTQRYRDASMSYFQPKSREFCIANTDVLFENKQYDQAIAALGSFYKTTSNLDSDRAVLAYLIAEGYRLKKDKEQQKNG